MNEENKQANNQEASITSGNSDSAQANEPPKFEPKIFISHPHDFRQIADALRTAIRNWSNNEIPIYQSSEAYTEGGPVVGGPLREEIKKELDASAVVIVVYVTLEQAGSCMFEAGIAYGGTMQKRLVFFQCGDPIPWAFRADLFINITESKDIEKFTWDFHHSDKFFPGLNKPLYPKTLSNDITTRASHLHSKLLATRPPILHTPRNIERWISITASLPDSFARDIKKIAEDELSQKADTPFLEKTKAKARELIKNQCLITNYTTTAPPHFGMNDFTGEDQILHNIYNRWKHLMHLKKKSEYVDIDWWSEICEQMTFAIANWPAPEVEIPLKSALEDETWYLPVLTEVVDLPRQQRWDFTIRFIRIPQSGRCIHVDSIEKG